MMSESTDLSVLIAYAIPFFIFIGFIGFISQTPKINMKKENSNKFTVNFAAGNTPILFTDKLSR